MDPTKRINTLKERIAYHDNWYYVQDSPKLSDSEYDQLLEELVRLEKENPELITPESPTQRVSGEPSSQWNFVIHRVPMLSLDNAFNPTTVRAFVQRVESENLEDGTNSFCCEPKFDGIAVALRYEDKRLVCAATRGDGKRGENITENVKTIRSIPMCLYEPSVPRMLEVRGEIIMYKRKFQALNDRLAAMGQQPFANPRNAAGGSLRQKDPRVTAERSLAFFAYTGLFESAAGQAPETQWEQLMQLKSWGIPVSPVIRHCQDFDAIEAYYQHLQAERDLLPFEIDGIVIKANAIKHHKRLGSSGRAPRWALAYKFPASEALTRLLKVSFQVGRTGVITPVAELAPVSISGVTITRATLHNRDELLRLELAIGDTVKVHRAGDVIPKVLSVCADLRPTDAALVEFPTHCPVCNAQVEQAPEEAITRCSGLLTCPAQRKARLIHFVSRDAVEVKGIGRALISAWVDQHLVTTPADIFQLDEKTLSGLDGLGPRSAQKLIAALKFAKKTTFARFLFALGIPGVGAETAQALTRQFSSVAMLEAASLEDFLRLPDIGPITAHHLVAFFKHSEHRVLIQALLSPEVGIHWDETKLPLPVEEAPIQHPFFGKHLLFTGKLESLTREEAAFKAKNAGAIIDNRLTKATQLVIVGTDPGSKFEAAQQKNIPCMMEAEFEEVINGVAINRS